MLKKAMLLLLAAIISSVFNIATTVTSLLLEVGSIEFLYTPLMV
jgi:hypothetical protein